MNKYFLLYLFSISCLLQSDLIQSSDSTQGNVRIASKAPTAQRKSTKLDQANKAYKEVLSNRANDAQVETVLGNILVDPEILNQNLKFKLFITIRNVMNSMQAKYGLSTKLNIIDEKLVAKYMDSTFKRLFIGQKIINIDDQINQNSINLLVAVRQNWPEINQMVIGLAEKKVSLIDLASDSIFKSFSFELKKIVKEMANGALELLEQIKKAKFVDFNSKIMKPSESEGKSVVLIFTKQNSHILTTAAKVSLWSKLSDEPAAEQGLESILEVPDSSELPVIANDENGKSFDRAKFEKILADFENQESKEVINPSNDNDQPQSIIPQLVIQPESQPESKAQTEKNEKIEEAGEDEPYVPVSSEWMNLVASTSHQIASSLVGVQMITQEDLMRALKDKNLDFAELSNPQNMAYMMGYLQSFIWSLQSDNGIQKRLVKIVEVVRSLKDASLL